jgi:hypothetical protein
MTRDRSSWSGIRYLETKRIRRLQNTGVAAARLTSSLHNHHPHDPHVQGTPYKSLEELCLEPGIRENAFLFKTPIKMSVLAALRGSSFQP